MKILKGIGFVLVIVVVLGAIGFFVQSDVSIDSSLSFEKSAQSTYDQVSNLKTWTNWSAWDQMDPNMKIEYSGAEAGKGAKRSWHSEMKEMGSGSMEIVEAVEGEEIHVHFDFGDMGTGESVWKFEEGENGTTVSSHFESKMPLIFKLMSSKMMQEYSDKTINSLRDFVNQAPSEHTIQVSAVDAPEQWILAIRGHYSHEEMGEAHEKAYGEIMAFMEEQGIEATGHPLAIYHEVAQHIDMEAGIPVSDSTIQGTDRIQVVKVPGSKTLTTKHMGSYNTLPETYSAFGNWMKDNNVQPSGAPWEVYTTNPNVEADTSKWATDVYFPVL